MMKIETTFLLLRASVLSAAFISTSCQQQTQQVDPPSSLHQHCDSLTLALQCTNGYYQEHASLLLECNSLPFAGYIRDACTPNLAGDYCGAIDFEAVSRDIETACFSNSSTSNCTLQCMETLAGSHNRLSCCQNLLGEKMAFNESLWSSCDVKLAVDDCQPSTIQLPETPIDPTCDDEAFMERLHTILCRRQYLEPIIETLATTAGCENYTQPQDMLEACTVNEFGRYCGVEPSLFPGFLAATKNCQNTSTCEPVCIETLRNITNATGCCVNYFNTSSNTPDWLRYGFWSECQLDTPGFCEVRLIEMSPTHPETSSGITTPSTATAATAGGTEDQRTSTSASTTDSNAVSTGVTDSTHMTTTTEANGSTATPDNVEARTSTQSLHTDVTTAVTTDYTSDRLPTDAEPEHSTINMRVTALTDSSVTMGTRDSPTTQDTSDPTQDTSYPTQDTSRPTQDTTSDSTQDISHPTQDTSHPTQDNSSPSPTKDANYTDNPTSSESTEDYTRNETTQDTEGSNSAMSPTAKCILPSTVIALATIYFVQSYSITSHAH